MLVEVSLAAATLCFGGECYPALVGTTTPQGIYTLQQYRVRDPRYGGDVMEFLRVGGEAFSVHRTWPGRERLYGLPIGNRVVTKGCINIEPHVYEKLLECCNGARIEIR